MPLKSLFFKYGIQIVYYSSLYLSYMSMGFAHDMEPTLHAYTVITDSAGRDGTTLMKSML
jgi:hypothetical protein